MAVKVAVMLGDGFEPVEAIAPIDCMRRAGINASAVSVMESKDVLAAQDIKVVADAQVDEVDLVGFDCIVVPGGSVGVENLKASKPLADALRLFMEQNRHVAAICAGPTVLNELGLLEGRKATCYPGCEAGFPEGVYQNLSGVVVDGNLITASGPGQALDFGIAVTKALCGDTVADDVASGMLIK